MLFMRICLILFFPGWIITFVIETNATNEKKNNKWDNRYIETYKEGKRRTKRQMIKCLRVKIQLCSNYTPSLWNKLCENAAYFMWTIDKNDNESSLKCLLWNSNANTTPHFVRHQFKSKHNFKHRTPFS